MKYKFYGKRLAAKAGDTLLVPFGKNEPSRFKILKINKKHSLISAEVLTENYDGADSYSLGQIVDLGKMIYEGYWCFKVEKQQQVSETIKV